MVLENNKQTKDWCSMSNSLAADFSFSILTPCYSGGGNWSWQTSVTNYVSYGREQTVISWSCLLLHSCRRQNSRMPKQQKLDHAHYTAILWSWNWWNGGKFVISLPRFPVAKVEIRANNRNFHKFPDLRRPSSVFPDFFPEFHNRFPERQPWAWICPFSHDVQFSFANRAFDSDKTKNFVYAKVQSLIL